MALEKALQVEWRAWFASPHAAGAKAELETARLLETPSVTPDITAELLRINRPTKSHLKADPHIYSFLESLDIEDLQRHIASQTQVLAVALGEWDDKRSRGWRKGRTKAQNFVVSFDRFLKAFSGILEIAKLADEKYGGAATKIFSLLWATVKIKADNDEAIVSLMECINDRLPDVDIYNQVYVDSVLGTMIATAFRDVLHFSQQATLYFQGRGISRAMKSIGNPVRFPDMQEQLVKSFTNIRVRCDALLAQRIAELSKQNAELLLQMKIMAETQHAERVRKLQKALGRHHSESKANRDQDLLEYRRFLLSMFSNAPVELAHMTVDDLTRLPEYQRWTAARSSLLFLHGRNDESWPVPQSWLSLAAVDLVERLRASEAKPLVVFSRCNPEDTAEDVMKELISQLLDLEPSVVKEADDMRDLELRISAEEEAVPLYRRDAGTERSRLDEYARALTSIIENCPRAVHLVINRPELCAGERMWAFVKALLRLVQDTQVKVMLVVRTELWNIESRLCDLDKGMLDTDGSSLVVLRRHQYELGFDERCWREESRGSGSDAGR